jgi:hypothetical protein
MGLLEVGKALSSIHWLLQFVDCSIKKNQLWCVDLQDLLLSVQMAVHDIMSSHSQEFLIWEKLVKQNPVDTSTF